MLDKTIPFKNIIMKCDIINPDGFTAIPSGYRFKKFEEGDEYKWAEIAVSVGDCDTISQAVDYFDGKYKPELTKFRERCIFVTDQGNEYIATCTAWYDWKDGQRIASLHWLLVNPSHQGKGIGRALLSKTLELFLENGEYPVYLHTQPWSYKAVRLYISMGFHMLKTEAFSTYLNQYSEAIEVLKPLLDDITYHNMIGNAK